MAKTKEQFFTDTCTLVLSKPAKGSGGDKFSATWEHIENDKERFIYVPQNHSRGDTNKQTLILHVQTVEHTEEDAILFELFKKAKGNGDDRYHHFDESVWKGDIYLPKEFRSEGNSVWIVVG